VIHATGIAVIGVIAGLQFLDALGINLAPLLASAGMAGVAIGLAAQNSLKDMLNGILISDRGPVQRGDRGARGRPERHRGGDDPGARPPSAMTTAPSTSFPTRRSPPVANLNMGYSVATVNVSVDFPPPDKVVELLKGVAMELRNQRGFP